MACLLASREESVGSHYTVTGLWGEPLENGNGIHEPTSLPIQRVRPPNFLPMARPEVEADPDAPVHPGASIWDFIDSLNLYKDDPAVAQAYECALRDYRAAMAEYRAAKAAKKLPCISLVHFLEDVDEESSSHGLLHWRFLGLHTWGRGSCSSRSPLKPPASGIAEQKQKQRYSTDDAAHHHDAECLEEQSDGVHHEICCPQVGQCLTTRGG
jgi:hypothetical protein